MAIAATDAAHARASNAEPKWRRERTLPAPAGRALRGDERGRGVRAGPAGTHLVGDFPTRSTRALPPGARAGDPGRNGWQSDDAARIKDVETVIFILWSSPLLGG